VRTLLLLPVLVVALGSAASGTAQTKPVILAYPYGRECPAAGYENTYDIWAMSTCNCTSYAAWALAANGRRVDWFQPGRMDAHNWPRVARDAGIPTGTAARVDAVAVWPKLTPPFGHVAFVTAVHPDGTFDVAEYNLQRRYRFDARYRVSSAGATFIYVPPR